MTNEPKLFSYHEVIAMNHKRADDDTFDLDPDHMSTNRDDGDLEDYAYGQKRQKWVDNMSDEDFYKLVKRDHEELFDIPF